MPRRTVRGAQPRAGNGSIPAGRDGGLHRHVAESSASGLFLVQDGRIRWANAAATAISGYSLPELSELSAWALLHPDSQASLREILERPPVEGWSGRSELRIVDRAGRDKWLEVAGAGILIEGRLAIVGTAIDITERKRLEAQLHQSRKMEALGRLAGGVAHDFNNLLTVMAGYAQMALNRLDPASPIRPDIEEILKNTGRAAALTGQLLAFSRSQPAQARIVDLSALIANALKMLKRMIGEDIRLEAALQPGLGTIRADPGQVEQVIMNLAVNARDAMPRGGVLRVATSAVDLPDPSTVPSSGLPPGPYTVLSVSDTGPGMTSEILARIFEPFFTTKEMGKGTGLGLSTVYGIVRQSGGDIAVESSPGKGSTFKVLFPAIAADVEAAHPSVAAITPSQGTGTILLVEDDSYLRDLLANALVRENYRVVAAADGQAGLRSARSCGTLDLLVTDVVMPGMGGVELAGKLSRRRPGLKVLFISGYSDPPVPEGNQRTLLRKPFTLPELIRAVRSLLEQAPQAKRMSP